MNEEHKSHKKRRKLKPAVFYSLIAIVVVCIVFVGMLGFDTYSNLQPVQENEEVVNFTIEDGSSLKTVSDKLANEGIVKDAKTSYYFAKFKHLTDIKAGNFVLDKSWSLEQIFTTLNDNSSSTRNSASVTIVEGDWAKHIANKFAEATNVTADELLSLWNNEEWIRSQMPNYPFLTEDMFQDGVRILLEGYLAPETYIVHTETTAEDITLKMLDQSLVVYNQYADQIAASSYSIHDIYTLASIVQYEGGGNEEDLAKIAGVFYNRLSIGMPLQSSVTVCYSIDFDQQVDTWQACEVNSDFDSPYNTYKYAGLPPGAIENAGTKAFEAVLNPNTSDGYLYFMAEVATGKVYYATTYEGHLQNIKDHPN